MRDEIHIGDQVGDKGEGRDKAQQDEDDRQTRRIEQLKREQRDREQQSRQRHEEQPKK